MTASRNLGVLDLATNDRVPGVGRWSSQTFPARMKLVKAYYERGIEHARLCGDPEGYERLKQEARRVFIFHQALFPQVYEGVEWEDPTVVVMPGRMISFLLSIASYIFAFGLYFVLRRLSVPQLAAGIIAVILGTFLGAAVRRLFQRGVADISEEYALDVKLQSLTAAEEKCRTIDPLDVDTRLQSIDNFLQKARSLGFYDPEMGIHPEHWQTCGNWTEEGFSKLLKGIQIYYAMWGQRELIKRDCGKPEEFEKVAAEARRFFAGASKCFRISSSPLPGKMSGTPHSTARHFQDSSDKPVNRGKASGGRQLDTISDRAVLWRPHYFGQTEVARIDLRRDFKPETRK